MSTEGTGDLTDTAGSVGAGSTSTTITTSTSGTAGMGSPSGTSTGTPGSGSGGATGGDGSTASRLSAAEIRSITEAVIAAIHTTTAEVPSPGTEGLPVDPSLGSVSGELSFPSAVALSSVKEMTATSLSVASTCLVAEGLPPIPTKLVDKIRRWEFVDLSLLLHDPSTKSEESLFQQQGSQIMIFQSVEQAQRRRKQITDVVSWTKAFSIYAAVLAAAEETTRQEVVGLLAHTHLITQLSRDLAGGQWISYDTEFREWAAAKGVRKWGELNLIIYGRCLSGRITGMIPPPTPPQSQLPPSKRLSIKRAKPALKVCFQWNFSMVCERAESCRFSHACFYCGDPSHRGLDCGKRSRRDRSAHSSE